ncbi:MAG: SDR family NAD(P)-dependent oxidoreductase, partial [Acidimicrobiales bacterium]
ITMDLRGKRVLVTGASKGIGEGAARGFAAAGARVALAARTTEAIEALADELDGDAYTVDLADPVQVTGFIDRVEADGALDVLVNNAGIDEWAFIDEMSEERIDNLLSLNLATPLKLTQQVLPGMIERGQGHIVQISSMASVSPVPGGALYCASKAGLTHATACMELDLRGTPVGLTTVYLGYVDNDMGRRSVAADSAKVFVKRLEPLGLVNLVDPDKAAAGIVEAVAADKRFVLYPKSAAGVVGLSNSARRILNGMTKGLVFRTSGPAGDAADGD